MTGKEQISIPTNYKHRLSPNIEEYWYKTDGYKTGKFTNAVYTLNWEHSLCVKKLLIYRNLSSQNNFHIVLLDVVIRQHWIIEVTQLIWPVTNIAFHKSVMVSARQILPIWLSSRQVGECSQSLCDKCHAEWDVAGRKIKQVKLIKYPKSGRANIFNHALY